MSTNVIGTDITSIARKVSWFNNMVVNIFMLGVTFDNSFLDVLVVIELVKMTNLSRDCNHTTTKTRNIHAHERVPTSLHAIPTSIEEMNLTFGTPTTRGWS